MAAPRHGRNPGRALIRARKRPREPRKKVVSKQRDILSSLAERRYLQQKTFKQ